MHRCLEKDPEQRFHSASDLAFSLEALSESGSAPTAAIGASSARRPRRVLLGSIAVVAVVLLAALAYLAIASRNRVTPLRISEYARITHNGHAGDVAATDGSRLYLQTYPEFSIEQVAASGGEIEPVSFVLPAPKLLTSRLTARHFSFSRSMQASRPRHRFTPLRLSEAPISTWPTPQMLPGLRMKNMWPMPRRMVTST